MKTITKAEAIKQGRKTYDGEPCKRGHDGRRFTKGGKCVECTLEATRKIREKAKARYVAKYTKDKFPVVEVHQGEVPKGMAAWRYYVGIITATWQRATWSIIETGALLNDAKSKVEHGDWLKLIKKLPFGERTAQRLMEIARHPILSDPTRGSHLPPSWRTLYELAQLPEPVLLARIGDNTINAEMERGDVEVIAASVAKEEPATHVVPVTYIDPDPPTETIIVPTYVEAEVIDETPPSEQRDHLGRTYDEKRWIENHLIRSIHEIDVGGFSARPPEELAAMIEDGNLPLVEKVAVFLTKLAEAMRRKAASEEAA